MGYSHQHHMEQVMHGFQTKTQNLIGSLFAVEAGGSGIEPFPRVMQDLIYGSLASSEVWPGNDKSRGRE